MKILKRKEVKIMENEMNTNTGNETKFCKHCGEKIDVDCVVCPKCGKQVEDLKSNSLEQPNIVINNTNTNINGTGLPKNKWVSVLLCVFLGFLGAHKFYEGKIGLGVLYLLTCGLCGIGAFVDFIILLFKPNPYYV